MKKKEKGKKTKVKKVFKKAVVSGKSDLKIRPLGDRVLIKPFDPEEVNKTLSGIIIPDTVSKEKPEQGKVVAVGDGKFDDGKKVPMSVKVGDKVVF